MNNDELLTHMLDFSVALSAEKDMRSLVERIFQEIKRYAHADGAALYFRTQEDELQFVSMKVDSLSVAEGGNTETQITLIPLSMFDQNGNPDLTNIATDCAYSGKVINIEDVYTDSSAYVFTGMKRFDKHIGYRSKSLLTVPLKDISDRVIAVIQLLNAQDSESGEVISFSEDIMPGILAIASQAAVALEKQQLLDKQKELLDSIEEAKETGSRSVFISHASKNRKFIEQQIIPLLEKAGIGYWYSMEDIQSASEWERSILNGLEQCEWFLIAMSPEALRSEWVKDELFWAIDNRPDHIIPVVIAGCNPADFHIRMRRFQVIDFTDDSSDSQEKLIAAISST